MVSEKMEIETMSDANYSRAALLKFADDLEKRGLAKSNTAQSLKVAANKILDGLSPDEEADVRKVDVETAVRKFHNKNPGKLSPKSLAEYQRRVSLLIRELVKYNENPTGYTGIGRGAPTSNGGKQAKKNEVKRAAEAGGVARVPAFEREQPRPVKSGLSLDYPLRPDFLAQVVVPRDLKADEARRLCAFVMTLAADFEPTRM
jgi:hypothetical protein